MTESPAEDTAEPRCPVEPSVDAVYAEWYNEKRRYRDFEQTISSWASTILLAISGGALAFLTGETAPRLSTLQKSVLVLAIVTITVIADAIVMYLGRRYRQLKKQAATLEPQWKERVHRQTVTPIPRVLNPLIGQVALITILGVLAIVVVLSLD